METNSVLLYYLRATLECAPVKAHGKLNPKYESAMGQCGQEISRARGNTSSNEMRA